MAWHDFLCAHCGTVLTNVDVPAAIGARLGAPLHCGQPTAWIPQVGRMDAACGPGFQAFEVRDGQNNLVKVDSLHKLRTLERESEQQHKNGEGQPLVFRAYSQNRSNHDVHSLDPQRFAGGEQPDPAWVKKHGAALRSATEPDVAYGPGIDDSTPSALSHILPKE